MVRKFFLPSWEMFRNDGFMGIYILGPVIGWHVHGACVCVCLCVCLCVCVFGVCVCRQARPFTVSHTCKHFTAILSNMWLGRKVFWSYENILVVCVWGGGGDIWADIHVAVCNYVWNLISCDQLPRLAPSPSPPFSTSASASGVCVCVCVCVCLCENVRLRPHSESFFLRLICSASAVLLVNHQDRIVRTAALKSPMWRLDSEPVNLPPALSHPCIALLAGNSDGAVRIDRPVWYDIFYVLKHFFITCTPMKKSREIRIL